MQCVSTTLATDYHARCRHSMLSLWQKLLQRALTVHRPGVCVRAGVLGAGLQGEAGTGLLQAACVWSLVWWCGQRGRMPALLTCKLRSFTSSAFSFSSLHAVCSWHGGDCRQRSDKEDNQKMKLHHTLIGPVMSVCFSAVVAVRSC